MSDSSIPSSPYDVLIGTELANGWTVTGRASRAQGSTGGTFSVAYHVLNSDGRVAFCKVLDYARAVASTNPVEALNEMTADFRHEVRSLEQCRDMRMRRVILALESSTVSDPVYPMSLLSYIIFEPAIGDLRLVLPLEFGIGDLELRFAILHDAVLGVAELHRAQIAHQDLKPSNVLAVERGDERPTGKVADLGRAIVADYPHRFDGMNFPGDKSYAPPEYLYGFVPSNTDQRRRGTDLYQLGSLMCFVLTGATMSALLYVELEPSLRWDAWRGDFADIEPALQEATTRVVGQVTTSMPPWAKSTMREIMTNLCDPNPRTRNGMTRKLMNVSDFSLSRVVSALDMLQKRASIAGRAA
jgi:serine/threonine protein kinase